MINKIATDVSLASQTHHVPHIGFPHIDPDIKHRRVKTAPIGAIALFIIKPKGIFKHQPNDRINSHYCISKK